MATRLYLTTAAPPSGLTVNSGSYPGWDLPAFASAPAITKLARAGNWPGLSAFASPAAAEASATNNLDLALARYLSDPLAGDQTVAGTLIGQMRMSESNAAMNALPQITLVVVGAGGGLRGVLFSGDTRTTNVDELTTTLQNRRIPAAGISPVTLASVAALNGDHLLAVVGVRAQNTATTSYTATAHHGATATPGGANDLAVGGAETTGNLNPWIQLSADLVFGRAVASVADVLSLGDAVVPVRTTVHPRAIADALGISEAQAFALVRRVSPADVMGMSDAQAMTWARRREVSELVGFTDATARAFQRRVAQADALGLVDAAAPVRTIRVSVGDQLALSDAASPARKMPRGVGPDTFSLTDATATAVLRVHSTAVGDALALTDSAQAARSLARLVSEGLTLTDAAATRSRLAQGLQDALALADEVEAGVEHRLGVEDHLALADEVAAVASGRRAVELGDALALTDTAVAVVLAGTGVLPTVVVALEPTARAAVALVPIAGADVALVPIAVADVDLEPEEEQA